MVYRYETIEYPPQKNRLDVDATYVILVGSVEATKRNEFADLSETVHFLHAPIMSTECYLSIFRDSLERKYDRILVLVDALSHKGMHDLNVVNAFMNRGSLEPYVYALGCVPILMLPVKDQTYRTLALGVCAGVYSKAFRNVVLRQHGEVDDWDLYLAWNSKLYTYARPLWYSVKYPWITKLLGYDIIYGCAKSMVYAAVLFALGLLWTVFHYDKVYLILRAFIRKVNICGYTFDPLIKMSEPILSLLRPSSLHAPS